MNTMSLNHSFLCINSELLYMESTTQLSLLLFYALHTLSNVTIHNEGVYILFPSCALKTVKYRIEFYLLTLTTINAFLSTKEERELLKVHLHYTSVPSFNYLI
jgi:hypothetical protein